MPTDSEHWHLRQEVAELRGALNKTIRLLRMTGMAAVTGGICTERELRAFVSMPLSDEEERFGFKPERPLAPPAPGLTRKEVLELALEVIEEAYKYECAEGFGVHSLGTLVREGLHRCLEKQEAPRS